MGTGRYGSAPYQGVRFTVLLRGARRGLYQGAAAQPAAPGSGFCQPQCGQQLLEFVYRWHARLPYRDATPIRASTRVHIKTTHCASSLSIFPTYRALIETGGDSPRPIPLPAAVTCRPQASRPPYLTISPL